ncbi:MAG: major capsid protein [Candidatus Cloacimonas sp.]
MPKGASDIPDLRLVVLKKTIESYMTPPNLHFMNAFPSEDNESDSIEWESITGTRGLTPFAAPGAPAKETSLTGHGAGRAMAAYWKEKLFFDEMFLNNLRQIGTRQVYMPAARKIAQETKNLRNRADRRKEWMFCQMITEGSFSYVGRGEVKVSVDYGVPAAHLVTLAADRKWDGGVNRDIVDDIADARLYLQNKAAAKVTHAVMTSEVLKLLQQDKQLLQIMANSGFAGQPGLNAYLTNPIPALQNLFQIPNIMVYDEMYEIRAWLTGGVTGGTTVSISVDNTDDFVVGSELTFNDVSAGTSEDCTISAVSPENGTVTVDTAPVSTYKKGEDFVSMTRKFLAENKFAMYCERIEGDLIGGYYSAPFGLSRSYGLKVSSWDMNDPEGRWVMVENKGLPVLYRPKGIYCLTVH